MNHISHETIVTTEQAFNLAEQFQVEAEAWSYASGCKEAILRGSTQLNDIARRTVRGLDPAIADAYIDAATKLLNQIIAARRFLTTLTAEPITPNGKNS